LPLDGCCRPPWGTPGEEGGRQGRKERAAGGWVTFDDALFLKHLLSLLQCGWMADVSLAVLRERELLEEVKVASEIRVIQAAMAPAVRGILSDLSEAKVRFFPPSLSWCFLLSFNVIAS
jgi:hypothetical protein